MLYWLQWHHANANASSCLQWGPFGLARPNIGGQCATLLLNSPDSRLDRQRQLSLMVRPDHAAPARMPTNIEGYLSSDNLRPTLEICTLFTRRRANAHQGAGAIRPSSDRIEHFPRVHMFLRFDRVVFIGWIYLIHSIYSYSIYSLGYLLMVFLWIILVSQVWFSATQWIDWELALYSGGSAFFTSIRCTYSVEVNLLFWNRTFDSFSRRFLIPTCCYRRKQCNFATLTILCVFVGMDNMLTIPVNHSLLPILFALNVGCYSSVGKLRSTHIAIDSTDMIHSDFSLKV